MSVRRRALRTVVSAGCAMTAAACAVPGTSLGNYSVQGTLESDSCGGAPDPWTFEVMLTQEGSTLYWNWLDASPMLSGPLSSDGHASLMGGLVGNVDGNGPSMGPCDLQRSDDIEVTLASGSPPGSFAGSIQYTFAPEVGATCSDQLASGGGMYRQLPCTIEYSIHGQRQ